MGGRRKKKLRGKKKVCFTCTAGIIECKHHIGPHHKIHEKGSNLNTVYALFSNLCLWVYTASACTNIWQIKHSSTHVHIQVIVKYWAWLASLTLIQKNVKWHPTVLKLFTETIKWMWIVAEEWWKSDGNNHVAIRWKRNNVRMTGRDLKTHGKSLSMGLVWTFNRYQE